MNQFKFVPFVLHAPRLTWFCHPNEISYRITIIVAHRREIKIHAIKFEFKNIFGMVPIPLPKIDPPDLTITIEPEKQAQ